MTCDAQAIFGEARAAQERLKSGTTFNDWIIYGIGLAQAQTDAMTATHTNEPKGRKYCAEMGAILKEQGLDKVDDGARSRLLKMMQDRPAIETWHATLEIKKRLKLNHPQAVWAAWSKAMGLGTAKPKPAKPELCTVWKNASTEERCAALDDGGSDRLLEDISPALRAEMTKCLKPTKTHDEVLGERICKEVDEIRALAVHYEQNKHAINAKLTAIKRATRGVGKAPVTKPVEPNPIVGKAIRAMGNGAGAGKSAAADVVGNPG
jgi:hypothetical protein